MINSITNTHCKNCGKKFNLRTEASVRNPELPKASPGDVYSKEGLRETQISGLCEYCFDRITQASDDFNS